MSSSSEVMPFPSATDCTRLLPRRRRREAPRDMVLMFPHGLQEFLLVEVLAVAFAIVSDLPRCGLCSVCWEICYHLGAIAHPLMPHSTGLAYIGGASDDGGIEVL